MNLATTRNHDVSDRLDGVTNFYGPEGQSFGVTEFDDMNRRKKIEREDGTRWAYGYNSKGEVASGLREKTAAPNSPVPGWDHAYTFDQIGNRNTTTINGRASTYTPNALNQYESRTVPRAFDVIGKANAAASVTVDGNPATRLDEFFYKELAAGSGAIHTPYVVQATDANGTTTRSGGKFLPATPENFVYDFDGNLTSDGRFTCTWDAENRLVSMETHASVPLAARRKLAFSYDSMGRRIRKSVWHGVSGGGWQLHHHFDFIHKLNGWNMLAERSGGSVDSFIRTYAWGTDLSGTLSGAGGVGGLLFATLHTSGKTFAYGSDLNGNITLLVDTATGQSAATYDYGPFGEQIRQSGEYATLNPYRFSTKYTDDETGWLDYGMRYYIPAAGRWPSRDPIGEGGGENLYAFANGDGVNNIDFIGQYTLGDAINSLRRNSVVPLGVRSTGIGPVRDYTNNQVFDEWHRLEKLRGQWWVNLPKCPLRLCIKTNRHRGGGGAIALNIYAKAPSKWHKPEKPSNAELNLHPGTIWSMRSKADGAGHANQCTYDSKGDLLTTPPGSGTVDWFRSGTQTHYEHDVKPVYLANRIDGGDSMGVISSTLFGGPAILGVPGRNLNMYFEVRPLWKE